MVNSISPGDEANKECAAKQRSIPRTKAIFAGLLVLTLGCSQAVAKKEVQGKTFGRYSLTKGIADPMCLAVGEQVAELTAVKLPESYPSIPQHKNIRRNMDRRCDVPLKNTPRITAAEWKAISVFETPESLGLYNRLHADNQMKRFYHFMPEVPLGKKRELVVSAQTSFVANLLANGVYRFESSLMGGGMQPPLQVYRLNSPMGFFNAPVQQCWSVSFDPKGPMAGLRGLSTRIAELFTFEDKAFALAVRPDRTISIFGFEELSTHTEDAFRTIDQDAMSQCQFNLISNSKD